MTNYPITSTSVVTDDQLAKDLGVSVEEIHSCVKELEAIGAVEVERTGLGQPNRYILALDKPFKDQR